MGIWNMFRGTNIYIHVYDKHTYTYVYLQTYIDTNVHMQSVLVQEHGICVLFGHLL